MGRGINGVDRGSSVYFCGRLLAFWTDPKSTRKWRGPIARSYITSTPTMPLAVVDGVSTTPVLYYVHTDHINRPIRMSTTAKVMVWQAEWNPWGGVQSLTGSLAQNLRFPGQWFQIETGLHYNWHRHYDPGIGRYTQPDPLGFVDGPSVYAYAKSGPLVATDFSGRFSYSMPWIPPSLPLPLPVPPYFSPDRPVPYPPGEWTMPPIRDPEDPGNRRCACRCRATDRKAQQSYFAERTADDCFEAARNACKQARKHCSIGEGDVHHQEAKCTDGTIRDGGGGVLGRYRYDG